MSRRTFLNYTAVGVAGATATLALPSFAAKRARIPVGLQLYSVREQAKNDLAGVLQAVAKMGYRGVEFAGYYDKSAADIRKMLDSNGLVACGTHTPYESILPAKLDETIEFNKTIGNKYLIVPWMQGKTKQEWLDKARLFNEAADKVKKHKMFVGYHAHAHDFNMLEGERAWDIFFGNTKKSVIMQLDTSNCMAGGADPIQVLKQYPARAQTVHLKANGGGPEAVIGEDKVNWPEVFKFCESKGKTQWYIVEHETSKDPMDAARRSIEALKRMGKA